MQDICGLVILSPISPNSSWLSTIRRLIGFYGLCTFILQSFLFIYYKILDIISLNIFPLRHFYSVKAVARRFSIPVYKPENINSAEFLSILKKIEPDLIVSVAATQVFKKKLLNIPPLGCINVHGALLPKYRGLMPSFWALANGEKETGVTVHYMTPKLDDGDIILQAKLKILPSDTLHSILRKSKRLGAELLLKAIEQIEKGTVSTKPNNTNQATYFSFPTKEDAKRFRQMGRKFR